MKDTPTYVRLVNRPGRFYVVNTTFGKVSLLDSEGNAFCVDKNEILLADAHPMTQKTRERLRARSTPNDYNDYSDFIQWLCNHRRNVYIHFSAPECIARARALDRYLEATGEELDFFNLQTDIINGKVRRKQVGACLKFPTLPEDMKHPGTKQLMARSDKYQQLSSLPLAWFLIEQCGFLVHRIR